MTESEGTIPTQGDSESVNGAVRPDEVILGEGGSSAQMRSLIRDVALFLPNLLKLLGRLLKDPRVPSRSKVLVGGLMVYLASPIDFVPDFIPVIGMADDVLLAVYGVKHLIDRAGEDVVLEHWDGPQDLLDLVRSVLETAGSMVPSPVRKWMDRLSG